MKKLLGILVLGLVWCNVGVSEEKSIIFLDCEYESTLDLATKSTSPTVGKFTFRINKKKEQKTLYSSVGLSATKSEGIVTLFVGSSTDGNYSFFGFGSLKDPDLLQIESIDINRINGKLTNHTTIFRDTEKKSKYKDPKPDAELIHTANCNIAEQKF